jgi:hypothetical protein
MRVTIALLFLVLPLVSLHAQPPSGEFPSHVSVPGEKSDEALHNERIARPLRNSVPIKREPRVLTTGLLAPSEEDRAQNSVFLEQKDTGLIRLMPREVYDWRTYKTEQLIDLRGAGAYFSFVLRAHEYGYGSDIQLDHGKLSVGFAGADYGFLTNLGQLSLDEITVVHPQATYISLYQPAITEPNARLEYQRFARGVNVDEHLYKNELPVEVGSTYLLRSIIYDDSDVLVAFKIVRKDNNGSIIVAWKILHSYDRPVLQKSST